RLHLRLRSRRGGRDRRAVPPAAARTAAAPAPRLAHGAARRVSRSGPLLRDARRLRLDVGRAGGDVSDERIRTEVAVIGSGPGGAVTAGLLAEAGRAVVLVEEGPHLALDSCPPFSRAEMVQKYRAGGVTVAMGTPKISYVEGRCVGGGSEINSG